MIKTINPQTIKYHMIFFVLILFNIKQKHVSVQSISTTVS